MIGLERLVYVEVLVGWRAQERRGNPIFTKFTKDCDIAFVIEFILVNHTHQSFSTLSSADAHAAALWMLCVLRCR